MFVSKIERLADSYGGFEHTLIPDFLSISYYTAVCCSYSLIPAFACNLFLVRRFFKLWVRGALCFYFRSQDLLNNLLCNRCVSIHYGSMNHWIERKSEKRNEIRQFTIYFMFTSHQFQSIVKRNLFSFPSSYFHNLAIIIIELFFFFIILNK